MTTATMDAATASVYEEYEARPETPMGGAFTVGNFSKGEVRGEVSRQWMNRPDDQKFTSLTNLRNFVRGFQEGSRERVVYAEHMGVIADGTDLRLSVYGDEDYQLNNWSFSQLCSTAKAPAQYLSKLPAELAAQCLDHGLAKHGGFGEDRECMLYHYENGDNVLRALTSPKYGRIHDLSVVDNVMQIAGDGTGDMRWKVPGVMDWGTRMYDPDAEVTKKTTTLFASDRDVFMFLVDDRNPIEVGKLANGDPDYVFRGFYVWNSEVGSRTFGLATMYLRSVCCNRLLWGVEGFCEMTFAHRSGAPVRFDQEVLPALNTYSDAATTRVLEGVHAAKQRILADDDEEADDYLRNRMKFSQNDSREIAKLSLEIEHRPLRSAWDFAQGITALARDIPFQDQRVAVELRAKKILDRVAA